ncbi:MAG: type II toxin-antitoxin system YhaV family toxin [Gemmatimonadota bacterium]
MGSRKGRSKQEEPEPGEGIVVVEGWTILAHPLFLDAMERLAAAVNDERASNPKAPPSGNAKLLGHLLDLAFVKIPQDPGSAAYQHGGTLADRRHWFRGKTGGGRYRLFYRYDSRARIIIYAWVNDEDSRRTYGSRTDAYAVFANPRTCDRVVILAYLPPYPLGAGSWARRGEATGGNA